MFDRAHVAALLGVKYVVGIAAKDLAGCFEKDAFRGRQNALQRETGIIDAIFAADKIGRNQGTIYPGQHVIVQRVHLSKCRSHLSDLRYEACGKGRESDVAFLEIDSLLS